MKRLLTLGALFLCSLLTFAQFSGSGSGTENDPYLILNPIQLNQLRNFLNKSGIYFKLMADIDLTEFLEEESPSQGWQPVGKSSSAIFKGSLDGNGHTISGLWIKRENTDYVGLFGYTSGAIIKNLKIVSTTIIGKNNVGGMSGYASSTSISNCIFEGNVSGILNVGGYIGNSSSTTMSDVSIIGNVQGTNDYVGGITGTGKTNTFINCRVTGSKVTGNNYVGGICGYGEEGQQLSNCYVSTNIYGEDYVGGLTGRGRCNYYIYNSGFGGVIEAMSFVGGIIGEGNSQNRPVSVNKCYSVGTIIARGDNVGGITGHGSSYFSQEISNNYFSGKIVGRIGVGGICGKGAVDVINCFSHGQIAGLNNVGGLVGELYRSGATGSHGNIMNSCAINTGVSATKGDAVARIVGYNNDGHIPEIGSINENKSYNRTIVICQGVVRDVTDNEQNGTGVSASTLKLKATYVAMGFDFNNTWEIQETESYPYFITQTAPPIITSQVSAGATTISGKCIDGGTITLDVDGSTQQMVSYGNEFSFTVSPLQTGQVVRVCAKAEDKEQSYYTTEIVASLGSGKENDPYQVYTASDLTSAYRKGYYKLMNDIDLTDYINQNSPSEGWQSIGRDGSETIHFDGDGHKITGLWCNSTRDNTGLFSCFANGTIKNLTVETAKGKQVKGGANTGILIGKMINGTIENCQVSGTVADGTPVGGMVGLFDGGKISLSQANVTINTTLGTSYVGGLVGEITGGEIDQCASQGTITATGKESYVGGLVGKNYATVTNSYSNAIVTSPYNAAGLIAYNYGVVDKCYATGDIFSNNYGAGVIGYNDGENAVVKNSVAMNNKIDVTYESRQVQQGGGYGQRIIGGIKNGAPAPELNNYALKTMQVSLNNVPQKVYDDIMNGVGKNGSDLAKGSTYQELGWDFSSIWTITEGESYPSLKKNPANVLKPGDDPEPEPTPTSDENLTVATVNTGTGKTATMGINLDNKATDLTAYQFDLKLPTGFTLAKDSKDKFQVTKTSRYNDDSQQLTVSLQEDGSYRFISFSMSNGVIEGTSGAILNAVLATADNVAAGTYEGTIIDIIFTKVDGTQLKLSDTKFNIVIDNLIMGDANGNGEVNVSDIVEIVNYILGKPSANFVKTAADLNKDGDVNVTDIVMVVNIIMSSQSSARQRSQKVEGPTDNDLLTLTEVDNGSLSLSMENRGDYVASQFDVRLSEGQTLEGITLNGQRSGSHLLTYAKTGNNIYKVIVYSLSNESFTGNSGELIDFKVKGSGNVRIENIVFVTAGHQEKWFAPLNSGTTGIETINQSELNSDDCYDLQGRRVENVGQKGIYIKNGKKYVVK